MRAVIVGHGPSMAGSNHGDAIDQFDSVIRMKRCGETLKQPHDFGCVTDVVVSSFNVVTSLPQEVPGCDYWAFVDTRHDYVTPAMIAELEAAVPCTILPDVCREWQGKYRSMRKPDFQLAHRQETKGASSDDLGHRHMSTGMHALIYTCEILKPDTVSLVGFDNIKRGGFTWSLTRGPKWNKYPDHNWETEHRMVGEVERHYGIKVDYL